MKDYSVLLAIAISGAAFFIALWAWFTVKRAAEYIRQCRNALLSAPHEVEENSRKRMEKRFEEGLQNIYNYGGNVARLRVEDMYDE